MSDNGKGSQRRPCCLTREAEELQWELFYKRVTEAGYQEKRKALLIAGKWWKK